MAHKSDANVRWALRYASLSCLLLSRGLSCLFMLFSAPAKGKLGVRPQGKVTKPKPQKERLLKGLAAALGSGVLVETPAGRSTAAEPSIEEGQSRASIEKAEEVPLALIAELPGVSASHAALKLEAQPSGEVPLLNILVISRVKAFRCCDACTQLI